LFAKAGGDGVRRHPLVRSASVEVLPSGVEKDVHGDVPRGGRHGVLKPCAPFLGDLDHDVGAAKAALGLDRDRCFAISGLRWDGHARCGLGFIRTRPDDRMPSNQAG